MIEATLICVLGISTLCLLWAVSQLVYLVRVLKLEIQIRDSAIEESMLKTWGLYPEEKESDDEVSS